MKALLNFAMWFVVLDVLIFGTAFFVAAWMDWRAER
jgi:hypothetical protein